MARTMTQTDQTLVYLNNVHSLPTVSVIAVKFAVILAKWIERRRTRAALAQLTGHQLNDVGLTPQQARWEAAKPFWML